MKNVAFKDDLALGTKVFPVKHIPISFFYYFQAKEKQINKDEEIRMMALDQKAKMTKKKEEKLRLNKQFRKL